jgi:DNA-directed RNA polymerase specialized sigma24 family protein
MEFPETRWSLIGRLAEEPDQVSVVMELYADPIARYLRAKFPAEQGSARLDDVIQEVLVYLMEHPDLLARARPGETPAGSASKFRYFIMTLAFNAARNAWRRQVHGKELNAAMGDGGETTVAEALAVAHQPADELAKAMDRAWAESLMAAAWRDLRAWATDGTLEAEVPRILEMNLVEGRNLREVAEALSLPLATCHRRLARGRTLLQKAITDRLRQAGEIAIDGDGVSACEVLLTALKS